MANKENNPIAPNHYQVGGMQVVDIWRAKLTTEELRGAFKANILKYVMRGDYKNGVEDYKKALVYLQWLIDTYEEKPKEDK